MEIDHEMIEAMNWQKFEEREVEKEATDSDDSQISRFLARDL